MEGVVRFSCPLSGCTSISPQILPGVQDLELQDNQITTIPLLNFPRLQKLDLAHNNISEIDDNAFSKLHNLTMLYLSNNRISIIKREYFHELANLKYLYLDTNQITMLTSNVFFPGLALIERLDLSTNQISDIDESTFALLDSMKFLHLERNNLSVITPQHFTGLMNLVELTLSENKITEFQSGTFKDLQSLQLLDLGYNQIEHLQNLSFCREYHDVYRSRLQRLVLNNNKIKSIEANAFQGLHSLQILRMAYNMINDFPTCYFPVSLEEISFHHMSELHTVPIGVFDNLTNLRTIELYGNPKLSVVSTGSFSGKFKHLKSLDLSRNNIRTMSQNVIRDWNEIPSVDLSGNPWNCDCKMKWMKEVYMNTVNRETIRCHTPHRLSGKSVSRIQVEEFTCGVEILGIVSIRERTGIAIIVLLSLGFIVFIGLFLYRCRRSVFPCHYGQTSKYRALYSPKGDEEADDIKITRDITVSQSEKKILQAETSAAAPAPVAL